jgi:hypothetical protein
VCACVCACVWVFEYVCMCECMCMCVCVHSLCVCIRCGDLRGLSGLLKSDCDQLVRFNMLRKERYRSYTGDGESP